MLPSSGQSGNQLVITVYFHLTVSVTDWCMRQINVILWGGVKNKQAHQKSVGWSSCRLWLRATLVRTSVTFKYYVVFCSCWRWKDVEMFPERPTNDAGKLMEKKKRPQLCCDKFHRITKSSQLKSRTSNRNRLQSHYPNPVCPFNHSLRQIRNQPSVQANGHGQKDLLELGNRWSAGIFQTVDLGWKKMVQNRETVHEGNLAAGTFQL